MDEFKTKVAEILACPICFRIPRDHPVTSCSSGHIVCEGCRNRLTFCPICRGSVHYCTNTIAGYLIDLVEHNCKYSTFGCEESSNISRIADHEKICPHRTIRCVFRGYHKRRFRKSMYSKSPPSK